MPLTAIDLFFPWFASLFIYEKCRGVCHYDKAADLIKLENISSSKVRVA
jgi:hypothetical protein